MQEALQTGHALVRRGEKSMDWLHRYTQSCFRAILQQRVGGDLWAKVFLTCGRVTSLHVWVANEEIEARL